MLVYKQDVWDKAKETASRNATSCPDKMPKSQQCGQLDSHTFNQWRWRSVSAKRRQLNMSFILIVPWNRHSQTLQNIINRLCTVWIAYRNLYKYTGVQHFLQDCTATSKDSDQTAHPRSLIRVFAVRQGTPVSLATYRVPCEDSD